jgi:DNA-binding NarL/FixJ family response regulator
VASTALRLPYPRGGPPVTGRDAELATLRAAVASLADGRGGIVWLEGEPGIGKSTLLGAAVTEARKRSCHVVTAVGEELGQTLPLRALIDGLRADAAEVVALLNRDVDRGPVNGHDAVPAAVEQLQVLMDRLCAATPVMLVFDDLQWADDASVLTWHRLSHAVGQIPLLLVSACRPVPARPSVASLRRGVAARDATVITLGPLSPDEVAGLAGRLTGAAPGPRLQRILAYAGGNPLYAGELVEALMRERQVKVSRGTAELVGAATETPPPLGGVIQHRLDFLPAEARPVLQVAAVLGLDFSVFDLATATGRPAGALLPVLVDAVAAGVLAEAGDRLEFRHGLIRQALYDATPASARSALHRQVAKALADIGLPVERVAAHLLAAPDGVEGWAVDWLADNAESLADRAADLAAELLPQVARRCPAGDPRHESLLRGLARALFRLRRFDEAETVARHARAVTNDPTRAAEMAWTLSTILFQDGRHTEALDVIEDSLSRPATSALWRARLRSWRAKSLPYIGRHDEGEAEARWALAEGERLADRITIGHALYARYMLADHDSGIAHVDRALDVVGTLPETTDLRITLLCNRAYNLDALGRAEPADRSLREAMMLAERFAPWRVPEVRAHTANRSIERGRWDDALAELESQSGSAALFEHLMRLGGLAFVAAHRDDRSVCDALLREADALPPLVGYMRANATLLYMARTVSAEQREGADAAVAVLADTVDPDQARDLYERWQWLPDLVRLALEIGDESLARAAVAAADEDATAEPLPRRVAAAQRARAILDGDSAALLALAAQEQGRAPLAFGQANEEAAVVLARADDVTGARAALTDAVRAYLDLGAGWDVRRADARLRRFGVRRGPRTVRRRPTAGWEALTPTEERVAGLVAQGRSNPDIAAEMLLSRRTVQAHVSNILAKLGFGSRLEIAREASRRAGTGD